MDIKNPANTENNLLEITSVDQDLFLGVRVVLIGKTIAVIWALIGCITLFAVVWRLLGH